MRVELTVNGETRAVEVEPRTSLLDCLRERLLLTGAHAGCEHGVCGACTVLVDGAPVRSCLMFAVQADGYAITTIEGVAPDKGTAVAVSYQLRRDLPEIFSTSEKLSWKEAATQRAIAAKGAPSAK